MVVLVPGAIGLVVAACRVVPGETEPGCRGSDSSVSTSVGRVPLDPYLPGLVLLVFLAVSIQWVNFQVSFAASRELGDSAERLAGFFGRFSFSLGIASFLLQSATSPPLQRFDIRCLLMAVWVGSVLLLLLQTLYAVRPWMLASGLFAIGTLQLRELEGEVDRVLHSDVTAEREATQAAKSYLARATELSMLPSEAADRWIGGRRLDRPTP